MVFIIAFDFAFAFYRGVSTLHPLIIVLMSLCIYFAYTIICLKGAIWEKIAIVILSYVVIALVCTIVPFIVSRLFNIEVADITNHFNSVRLFTLFLTKFFTALSYYYILKLSHKIKSSFDSKQLFLISIEQLISIVILFILNRYIVDNPYNKYNIFFMYVAFLGILISNILFYIVIYHINKSNAIKINNLVLQKQYEYQKQYAQDVKQTYEQTRQIKHDLKNHMTTLHYLLQDNQIEKALQYTGSFSEEVDKINFLVETGNSVIDAIINAKIANCKAKNFKVITNINCDLCNVDSLDTSTIISNLFDNAIEACEKNEQNIIFFSIDKKKDYTVIEMKNPINESVLNTNPNLNTSKKDKECHGFGTKNILKVAKKHAGLVDYYEESDMFICNVMLKFN